MSRGEKIGQLEGKGAYNPIMNIRIGKSRGGNDRLTGRVIAWSVQAQRRITLSPTVSNSRILVDDQGGNIHLVKACGNGKADVTSAN